MTKNELQVLPAGTRLKYGKEQEFYGTLVKSTNSLYFSEFGTGDSWHITDYPYYFVLSEEDFVALALSGEIEGV